MTDDKKLLLTLAAASAAKMLIAAWMRMKKKSEFVRVGTVEQINCYPVKSCQPLCVDQATCLPPGISVEGVTDRTWMFVRPNGGFLSQRQFPKMVLIRTSIHGDELHLDAPEMPTLKLPKYPVVEKEKIMSCRVWDLKIPGMDCGPEANRWVCQFLEQEGLRLVVSTPDMQKKDCSEADLILFDNPAHTGDTVQTDSQRLRCAFSDLTPYLILNEKSLEELNSRLKRPVSIQNFRPNIVIKDAGSAYVEDTWSELKIGDGLYMRCLHPCPRCHLPTVDPVTGERDPDREPFVTLQTYRCLPGGPNDPFFGINAAVDFAGDIKVGDPVYAIKKKASEVLFQVNEQKA